MIGAEALHPAVLHHIVNTLGWPALRPLQEQAIAPVLAGEHALLLAPTAGGKTEAAVFPLLSRMLTEDWRRLSVLYVCPLRALLNNLAPRLERYCGLVGRHAALWHGDVGRGDRGRLLADPPDLLLTTPESLEAMLTSASVDAHTLLRDVRAVVVDEIHAFAGDDRGWHLLAVLERVSRIAGRPVQRIGLSATVGEPAQLLDWLRGSDRDTAARVVAPAAERADTIDVTVDYVGNVENAALVISRLHRGEKRLVFADSRARVEDLAAELRRLDVTVFVSHGSLSADERRQAEGAFAEARACVIVATSTLELGLDVGDLDRVIQIDAPATVASFLQGTGRTGRRPGTPRNCLFLALDDLPLLQAAALIDLWCRGYVEPVTPPPRPLHILAQQIMALVLQAGRIGRELWRDWVGDLPAFADLPDADVDAVLDHMLDQTILFDDARMLSFGVEGEHTYGRRHFLENEALPAALATSVLAARLADPRGCAHALSHPLESPRNRR